MVDVIKDIDPKIANALGEVHDPEIPVLSLLDMGVIRNIER